MTTLGGSGRGLRPVGGAGPRCAEYMTSSIAQVLPSSGAVVYKMKVGHTVNIITHMM